jgi:hypothetical protein
MCYQGADCPYLHRLPHSADNAAVVRSMTDIFGREKMPAGMENKKGAGSYELDMTTLYVHYGGAGNYAVPQLRHLLLQVHCSGSSSQKQHFQGSSSLVGSSCG